LNVLSWNERSNPNADSTKAFKDHVSSKETGIRLSECPLIVHARLQAGLTERTECIFFQPSKEEALGSSAGQNNHGNYPAEKEDIDEKSFHLILYRQILHLS
jgi:hypothetical protein